MCGDDIGLMKRVMAEICSFGWGWPILRRGFNVTDSIAITDEILRTFIFVLKCVENEFRADKEQGDGYQPGVCTHERGGDAFPELRLGDLGLGEKGMLYIDFQD
jgi:hypothetical protein